MEEKKSFILGFGITAKHLYTHSQQVHNYFTICLKALSPVLHYLYRPEEPYLKYNQSSIIKRFYIIANFFSTLPSNTE